jgi:hypothetical protein
VILNAPARPAAPFPPADLPPDRKTTVPLPGVVRFLCYAGGGRYLVFYGQTKGELVVFDASAAKVAYTAPVTEPPVVAANRSHLFVFLAQAKTLERWAVGTGKKELSVAAPFDRGILAAGSDADGPLFAMDQMTSINSRKPPTAFDPATLKDIPLKAVARPYEGGRVGVTRVGLAVSADGGLVVTRGGLFRVSGSMLTEVPGPNGLPSGDGNVICRVQEVLPVGTPAPPADGTKGPNALVWYLPAADGPFVVAMDRRPGKGLVGGTGGDVRLHVRADPAAVCTVPVDDLPIPKASKLTTADLYRGHVFALPRAKVLAVLTAKGDALDLRPLDVEKAVRAAEKPVLAVLDAPGPATRGSAFRYLPDVLVSKGPIKAKLESAPEGMKLTPAGLVWDVPKDYSGDDAKVLMLLTDAAGTEVYQDLTVAVRAKE